MSGGTVFARIARRYDRLNALLSLGRDGAWRRRAIGHLPPGLILDLGGGTGAANRLMSDRDTVALDPAFEMLDINPAALRVVGIGEQLPFRDAVFDGVFSAFVFRNLDSVPKTLAELARVLRYGGVAVVVDLGRPPGRLRAQLHRAGTAVVLPVAGSTIGARGEYTYLHRSLDRHPPPEKLLAGGPLRLDHIWRMGPMGFVWGAVLRNA